MMKTCSMNPLKQKTTMKKNSFLWAALSMTAALVMTACSSDNDVTETPQAPSTSNTIHYTVTVGSGDATTRATVNDDPNNRALYFAMGDKLYITGTDIQGVLDIQSGVGDASNARLPSTAAPAAPRYLQSSSTTAQPSPRLTSPP